ncbi:MULTISPECIES: helix-turn-helix domain-containing protein [Bacteroides]|nr:helix-turn-helix transcriptional regulator [Bacteroides acidifaciens]
MDQLNRIKGALADTSRTGEWLAEQLEKEPVTVSKWCTNSSQPNLQTLYKIAELLNLDIIARAKTNYSIRRLE